MRDGVGVRVGEGVGVRVGDGVGVGVTLRTARRTPRASTRGWATPRVEALIRRAWLKTGLGLELRDRVRVGA